MWCLHTMMLGYVATLCRGSCFLSYTAESSHHLMAKIVSKEVLCQEENITSKHKRDVMQLRRTRQKTNSLCLGESPREGNPSHPPPTPRVAPRFGDSPTWGNAKLVHQTPKWVTREGVGGGQFRHFSNNSTMKQYFKMPISHEDMYSLLSPYCSVKVCLSPFYVL
jgi:hypothetical protein